MNKVRFRKFLTIVIILLAVIGISIISIIHLSEINFKKSVQNDVTFSVNTFIDDESNLHVRYIVDNDSDFDIFVEVKNKNINDGNYFDLSYGDGDAGLIYRNTSEEYRSVIEFQDVNEARLAEKNYIGLYTVKVYRNLKNEQVCEFDVEM